MTEITNEIIPCGAGGTPVEVPYVTLTNAAGNTVRLSALGAGIRGVTVPDSEERMADVALGYAGADSYFMDGPCMGKTAGRYANRIGAGKLTVDGRQYQLAVNCGPHHLHGGPMGFQNRVWKLENYTDNSVTFSLVSPDGDENYPGTVKVILTYTWTDDNRLILDFEAETDAPTVINLTNHTYWNLSGHAAGNVLDHTLRLSCSRVLEADETLLPTGRLTDVKGTPMDFTAAHTLGERIKADFAPLRHGKGYDHCWAVDGYDGRGTVCHVAELKDSASGRVLNIYSNQPGVQLYTGNWLTDSPQGKDGADYQDYDAVALECQDFPDAPNRPEFPSTLLSPGQEYKRTIIYEFTTEK
ncbi:MAG: galactose mutarotase [Muribaculaceae bacterium]|nr:galactose mutarotase [Muribaculaceae bacterium]